MLNQLQNGSLPPERGSDCDVYLFRNAHARSHNIGILSSNVCEQLGLELEVKRCNEHAPSTSITTAEHASTCAYIRFTLHRTSEEAMSHQGQSKAARGSRNLRESRGAGLAEVARSVRCKVKWIVADTCQPKF
ncbi:unnamed protein product [Ixodes pacificus]